MESSSLDDLTMVTSTRRSLAPAASNRPSTTLVAAGPINRPGQRLAGQALLREQEEADQEHDGYDAAARTDRGRLDPPSFMRWAAHRRSTERIRRVGRFARSSCLP